MLVELKIFFETWKFKNCCGHARKFDRYPPFIFYHSHRLPISNKTCALRGQGKNLIFKKKSSLFTRHPFTLLKRKAASHALTRSPHNISNIKSVRHCEQSPREINQDQNKNEAHLYQQEARSKKQENSKKMIKQGKKVLIL